MSSEIVQGIIRALLAAAGGYLANKGYTDSTTWATVSGAIVVVGAGVWSIVAKVLAAKKAK